MRTCMGEGVFENSNWLWVNSKKQKKSGLLYVGGGEVRKIATNGWLKN